MRLLAAAAVAATALVAPPASAAAPPVAPSTVVVTGQAGRYATFRLDRTARLGNGGADTAVTTSAPWGGLAITRLDAPESRGGADTFVHYRLRDPLLCPGTTCEPPVWLQPTAAFGDDGKGHGVLAPGRYAVALVGPEGATVTVTIRFKGLKAGRTTYRADRTPVSYEAKTFDPTVAQAGSTLASRGFARYDPNGRLAVDSLALAVVLDKPAAVHRTLCVTYGGRRDLDGNVGGTVPCADASGFDLLLGPSVDPVVVPPGEKSIGLSYTSGVGRGTNIGSGYEAEAGTVGGRIAAVWFAAVFPA